jgi:hypothetical protein
VRGGPFALQKIVLLTRIDLDEEFHFGLFLKIYAVDASTSRRSVFSEELGGV